VKLLEIIEKAINKEFGYNDAIQELKKLSLPYEEQEKYEILLYKLLGKEGKLIHDPQYFFSGIPNDSYLEILELSIHLVREGLYTPEIAQHLFDEYYISAPLITYFINEAISIVRMNNISPEEIASIGEAYHIVASQLEARGVKKKPVIKLEKNTETNAEYIDEMTIGEDDDDEEDD
jgi:hypothetical protein